MLVIWKLAPWYTSIFTYKHEQTNLRECWRLELLFWISKGLFLPLQVELSSANVVRDVCCLLFAVSSHTFTILPTQCAIATSLLQHKNSLPHELESSTWTVKPTESISTQESVRLRKKKNLKSYFLFNNYYLSSCCFSNSSSIFPCIGTPWQHILYFWMFPI